VEREDFTMFKWLCLLVAVAALSAFGWMLNDVRLEVKRLAQQADKLAEQAEVLVERTDRHLPRILSQTEQVAAQLDGHLPRILKQTEQAAGTINTQLPVLLTHSESAVDNIADLSDSFKQYKGLMGIVHVATQNRGLFSYGSSILSFLGRHDATIGVKKPDGGLRRTLPAKVWAGAAAKDVHFLSLVAKSKEEMLHGLARTNTTSALHIQVGDQPPRPLAEWVREVHPESKDLK
jgi:hypothetical protein